MFKYLVPGHTFMRADSVHGAIGSKMKEEETIDTFDDFVQLSGISGKRNKPVPMNHGDFFEFRDGHKVRKADNFPKLCDVCIVKFEKGSKTMHYKNQFDDSELNTCKFLRQRIKLSIEPLIESMSAARGIIGAKKAGIVKLAQSLSANKAQFWLDLPEKEGIKDLVHEND